MEDVSAAEVPADITIFFKTSVLPLLANLSTNPALAEAASPTVHKLQLLLGH